MVGGCPWHQSICTYAMGWYMSNHQLGTIIHHMKDSWNFKSNVKGMYWMMWIAWQLCLDHCKETDKLHALSSRMHPKLKVGNNVRQVSCFFFSNTHILWMFDNIWFRYHSSLKTRQKLAFLGKIALLSICSRLLPTQNNNAGITLWYPPNANIWLVLRFWYPRVGSQHHHWCWFLIIIGPCIHVYIHLVYIPLVATWKESLSRSLKVVVCDLIVYWMIELL